MKVEENGSRLKLQNVAMSSRLTVVNIVKKRGAQWLSGRVRESRPRGSGLKPHRRHYVASLTKTH